MIPLPYYYTPIRFRLVYWLLQPLSIFGAYIQYYFHNLNDINRRHSDTRAPLIYMTKTFKCQSGGVYLPIRKQRLVILQYIIFYSIYLYFFSSSNNSTKSSSGDHDHPCFFKFLSSIELLPVELASNSVSPSTGIRVALAPVCR